LLKKGLSPGYSARSLAAGLVWDPRVVHPTTRVPSDPAKFTTRLEAIYMADVDELKAVQEALALLWPLDAEARARAVAGIAGALGVGGVLGSGTAGRTQFGAAGVGSSNGAYLGEPEEFLALKAPETDVERVAVLAYYLKHARGQRHFKTRELSELNLDAAGPRLSNASYTASNATKKMGYLAAGPGGTKQITKRGEALVENLPDRAAAKAAVEALPGKPRRASGGRKKKQNTEE
jgi:hypothetical protein